MENKVNYKGKIILVIENDLNLQENIKDFLEKEGFRVITESDGVHGILKAINTVPDIILCSVSVPIKNGFEILEELSKNEKTKAIPFIFLAANVEVEKEDIRKALQLGADDFIFKPFTLEDVLNSIKIRLLKYEPRYSLLKSRIIEKKYEPDNKIFIECRNIINIVKIRDIKFIKAESPYIMIKCSNGKKMLIRGKINDWEEKLPENMFLRIHRSTIINIDMITRIEKISSISYHVKLVDENETFIISKRFAAKMKDKILR